MTIAARSGDGGDDAAINLAAFRTDWGSYTSWAYRDTSNVDHYLRVLTEGERY